MIKSSQLGFSIEEKYIIVPDEIRFIKRKVNGSRNGQLQSLFVQVKYGRSSEKERETVGRMLHYTKSIIKGNMVKSSRWA
jgi:hypothetical protein